MCCDPYLYGAGPLGHHLVQPHLEHLIRVQRSAGQHDAEVKVVRGIRPVGRDAAVNNCNMRATGGVEQETIVSRGGEVQTLVRTPKTTLVTQLRSSIFVQCALETCLI